ncbi:branched-chain amino acid ABC transporter ATP-binding protein/permease [Paenibacillus glycanilyticus]|uniref:Branched-chain amino acid ABC transporter permease n=1 Tax=Paenibacillus glycanilyticus TaxID=126569 RepID=A0ABQ6GPI3_9BACL|nr:branched-chain amino acid ABC transporter ATP-binding protein/permease [Paenibacillus glycanilyticus]GLX70927.1 branched-chain amino acid ABC transporter permease [Paenibacillus glycanilyticus]
MNGINKSRIFRRSVPVGGIVAAAALVSAAWTTDTYMLNLFFTIGIYVITCVGMNILVGYCGIVSIGHAGLMAAGAYTSAIASTQYGLNFWLSALAGIAVSLLIGSIIAIPTIKAGGVYLSMITIAFGVVVHEALIRWDVVTGGPLGISGIPKPKLGGYDFDLQSMYVLVLVIAAASLVLAYNIRRSAWGRSMIATKENEIAAASLGIRKFKPQFVGFAVSSVLAGLAGTLYAHTNSFISPDTYHFQASVQLVLIVILGGSGTLLGPVIGAIILVFLPELLEMEKLRMALYGGIMFAVLYFLPKGIMGTLNDWLEARLGLKLATQEDGRLINATSDGTLFEQEIKSRIGKAAALRLDNIHKSFGGLKALSDVSFAVTAGTIHSLVGPNGAGKTTLLNVISGLYAAESGTMELHGTSLSGSLSSVSGLGIARTFQHSRLFKELTVLENVMTGMTVKAKTGLGAAMLRTPGQRRKEKLLREKAHLLLDLIGFEGNRHMSASQLPYGHQRMVEIARALATGPSVLLLDEPAAGMTAAEIKQLEDLLKQLVHYGLTIVLIEHHMDFVQRVSDAVTVLDFGRVIGTGKPEELLNDPRVIQAYLGKEEVAADAER